MVMRVEQPSTSEDGILELLVASLSAHKIYLWPVALYGLADEALHLLRPDIGPANFIAGVTVVFLALLPFLLPVLVMMRFYHIARYVQPESPIRALLHDIPRSLVRGVPIVIVVAVIGFIFTDIQGHILTLNPNTWDVTFANLDRILHFGYQPWEILQALLGYAPITFLINVNYNLWSFTMIALLVHFGFASQDTELRTRFF